MISRQEKMAFSNPVGLSWDFPPPPTESVRTDGHTDVRMYGRTDYSHVTITSQPKFLGLIGYHISLAMELRWRALPARSAKNSSFSDLKIAHEMLFTTSIIWQYREVYEDEIQEWIEYAMGKRIMIGVRSTDS